MPQDWTTPPGWMTGNGAISFWPEIVAELEERGRLRAATRMQVAWFCQLLAVYVRAHQRVLSPDGLVDEFYAKGDDERLAMRLPSAEVKVYFTALAQLRKLTKELGLNDIPLAPPGRPAAGSSARDQLRHALGQIAAGGLN